MSNYMFSSISQPLLFLSSFSCNGGSRRFRSVFLALTRPWTGPRVPHRRDSGGNGGGGDGGDGDNGQAAGR